MVKRYTLSCNPDGFAVEPFDTNLLEPTVIVRGSDYDAVAARLAEAEAWRDYYRAKWLGDKAVPQPDPPADSAPAAREVPDGR